MGLLLQILAGYNGIPMRFNILYIDLEAASSLFCNITVYRSTPYTLMIQEYPSIIDGDMPLHKLYRLISIYIAPGFQVLNALVLFRDVPQDDDNVDGCNDKKDNDISGPESVESFLDVEEAPEDLLDNNDQAVNINEEDLIKQTQEKDSLTTVNITGGDNMSGCMCYATPDF